MANGIERPGVAPSVLNANGVLNANSVAPCEQMASQGWQNCARVTMSQVALETDFIHGPASSALIADLIISKPVPMTSLHQRLARMIVAWRERPVGIKLLSFAAVGAVNTLVDLGVFSLAYFYFDVPLVLSNVLAWSCAVTGSYVLNTLTTFARESGRTLNFQIYVRFVLSQVAGLVANTATIVAMSYFMPVLVGKLFAIGVSFLVNFALSHFVVFPGRIVSEPGQRKAMQLGWACPAVIVLVILGVLGTGMLFHFGATPSATDISSRSRFAPAPLP
jgi:putative flippase GtrA